MISKEPIVSLHPLSPSVGSWKLSQYRAYVTQFLHLRKAFMIAHAWKNHSYYVRARIDVLFDAVPVFSFRKLVHKHVFAKKKKNGWSSDKNVTIWQDWLYVAGREGMNLISDVSVRPVISETVRCFGLCPEELIYSFLKLNNFTVIEFKKQLTLTKIDKKVWCRK